MRSAASLNATGHLDESPEFFRQAVDLPARDGPARPAGAQSPATCDLAQRQDRTVFAIGCYSEALRLYRSEQGSDQVDLASALRGFGISREYLGDLWATRGIWEEVQRFYADAGLEEGEAEVEHPYESRVTLLL